MAFSNEEFNIMVDELLCRKPISFDMLCRIAEKTLRSKVLSWCYSEKCLAGRTDAEDIMQEILIRLYKTTIPFFLLKDGVDGPVNNDPIGFKNWMFTVAKNIKNDYVKKAAGNSNKIVNVEDDFLKNLYYEDGDKISDEQAKKLNEAFFIVMSASANVYKILTWLAHFIIVIKYDVTKIDSNDMIRDFFEKKTLFEMYDMLLDMSGKIDWLEIPETQKNKIYRQLNKLWNENQVYGDVKYKEFYMKYMGKKDGKKSISDWVSRMNKVLQRKLDIKSMQEKKITGRDTDESSAN